MIKLKDILFESTAPDIFIPRRIEGRVERMIRLYVRNGSKGGLRLNRVGLTKLPDILNNIRIGGEFDCSGNNLTSLVGAPSSVGEDFNCNDNHLTSLENCPKTVGRNFDCSYNDLTSLAGAPKIVDKDFHCRNNTVQFTEQDVRAVCDVKGKIFV